MLQIKQTSQILGDLFGKGEDLVVGSISLT